MRRQPLGIAGIVLAALALAGCGEDQEIQQGTVPFSGTNTQPLDGLRNDMQKKMQDKSYVKKDDEGGKTAGESKGAGAAKPAAESKPADASKPAGESKPAPESKPAAKGG